MKICTSTYLGCSIGHTNTLKVLWVTPLLCPLTSTKLEHNTPDSTHESCMNIKWIPLISILQLMTCEFIMIKHFLCPGYLSAVQSTKGASSSEYPWNGNFWLPDKWKLEEKWRNQSYSYVILFVTSIMAKVCNYI